MTPGKPDSMLDPVRRLYAGSLLAHGAVSQAVGWKDEASHRLRFEKLASVIEPGLEPITVNDLGCGYGAMFEFLADRLGPRLAGYLGIDISEEMVEAARVRVDDPRARFLVADCLGADADYTFVSGTFNVKMEVSDREWADYIEATLVTMGARSRKGLAFNLLTTYVDWRVDHLYYGDPCRYFDFCRRRLSRRVTLLHDYPLYEWTILVRT